MTGRWPIWLYLSTGQPISTGLEQLASWSQIVLQADIHDSIVELVARIKASLIPHAHRLAVDHLLGG